MTPSMFGGASRARESGQPGPPRRRRRSSWIGGGCDFAELTVWPGPPSCRPPRSQCRGSGPPRGSAKSLRRLRTRYLDPPRSSLQPRPCRARRPPRRPRARRGTRASPRGSPDRAAPRCRSRSAPRPRPSRGDRFGVAQTRRRPGSDTRPPPRSAGSTSRFCGSPPWPRRGRQHAGTRRLPWPSASRRRPGRRHRRSRASYHPRSSRTACAAADVDRRIEDHAGHGRTDPGEVGEQPQSGGARLLGVKLDAEDVVALCRAGETGAVGGAAAAALRPPARGAKEWTK